MTSAQAARAVAFALSMAAGGWPAPTPAGPISDSARTDAPAFTTWPLRTRLIVTGIHRAFGVRQIGRSADRQILQRQPP